MADLYKVEFRGTTMLSASEGEYVFQRGLRRRRVVVEDVIGGGVIKDGCRGTATHVLTLEFATTTTTASAIESAVYDRLQDLWDGVSGTLKVPQFIDLTNCVITNIDLGQQTAIAQATPLNQGSTGFTQGITVQATITFEQV